MLLGAGPGLNFDFATSSFQVPASPFGACAATPVANTAAATASTTTTTWGIRIFMCMDSFPSDVLLNKAPYHGAGPGGCQSTLPAGYLLFDFGAMIPLTPSPVGHTPGGPYVASWANPRCHRRYPDAAGHRSGTT